MFTHITKLLWNTRRRAVPLMVQIALAFLILFGVFSFASKSFEAYRIPLGFDTDDVYVVQVAYANSDTSHSELADRLLSEVRQLPEVASASRQGYLHPFSNNNMTWGARVEEEDRNVSAGIFMAGNEFDRTVGLNMVKGRWLRSEDTLGGIRPFVINKALEDEYYPDGITLNKEMEWLTDRMVPVGVVEHFKYNGEFDRETPMILMLDLDLPGEGMDIYSEDLIVRGKPGSEASIQESLFKTTSSIIGNERSVVFDVDKQRQRVSARVWVPLIALLTICGFLIANVAFGLFGVLMNAAQRRRGEIALRKALGATGIGVTAQLTAETLSVAIVGILIGAVFAVQLVLFKFIDLETTYLVQGGLWAALLIITLVTLCALIPSIQASRARPAVVLRSE